MLCRAVRGLSGCCGLLVRLLVGMVKWSGYESAWTARERNFTMAAVLVNFMKHNCANDRRACRVPGAPGLPAPLHVGLAV